MQIVRASLVCTVLGFLFFAGATLNPPALFAASDERSASVHYTCPMPEDNVFSDKPGRCPRCGMNLIPTAVPRPIHSQDGHPGYAHSDGPIAQHAADLPDTEPKPSAPSRPASPSSDVYYCPMHPTYTSARPGECLICDMTLVKLETDDHKGESSVPGYSVIAVSPERQQLIGVRIGTVDRREVVKTLRAAARVEASEERLSTVNLKFSGWIEELTAKSTGVQLEVGSPLFSIYSPEILEAQKNYLIALQGRNRMPGAGAGEEIFSFAEQTVRSARERLILWNISAEQLRELETRMKPNPRMKVFSQVKGVVMKRNVVQGSYIQSGTDLYEIADLSVVWVYADLYASESSRVQVGGQGIVELTSRPEQSFPAKIVYIYPYLNELTRTVRVRFEVANPTGSLRPGDYGTVSLKLPLGEQLVVDERAVLMTGERQIVFVDRGAGKLEPREIKTGERVDGAIVVLDGLEAGERVVTSGNFLIDSESRLKAALSQGVHAH